MSKLDKALSLLRQVLPEWASEVAEADGRVCCELTNRDVVMIRDFLCGNEKSMFSDEQVLEWGRRNNWFGSLDAARIAMEDAASLAEPVVVEACVKVCESRARSLFEQSHKPSESLEATKCAKTIRNGYRKYLT